MTLTSHQIAALQELDKIWPTANAVLIGATALGFHFDLRWRATADVDLAVALELEEFPGALSACIGWRAHPKKEHEFTSPAGAKVDLIPAGPSALAAGRLRWRSGRLMSLACMDLAFQHAQSHLVQSGYSVRVAPPPVLALLKMVAFADRPAERQRDLEDLAHLLDEYVDERSERRWTDALDCAEFDLAPAYLLGLDIQRVMRTDNHEKAVEAFLELVEPASHHHTLMRGSGPLRWKTEEHPLLRRLQAFRAGMAAGDG